VYSVWRVPHPGDELTLDGYRVVVERVEQRGSRRCRSRTMSVALAVCSSGCSLPASPGGRRRGREVSQHELTRWVPISCAARRHGERAAKSGAHAGDRQHAHDAGRVAGGGAIPALLAAATPTFLGIFTITVGVPLFIAPRIWCLASWAGVGPDPWLGARCP